MDRRSFLRAVALTGLAAFVPGEARSKPAKGRAIVVGAGVSGLAAARALVKAGWQVEVVEARDRVGGRVITDTSLGVPIDLGAAWIHGPNKNPVAALAKSMGIRLVPTDWDALGLYDGGKRQAPRDVKRTIELWSALERSLRRAKEAGGGGDLGAAMRKAVGAMKLSPKDTRNLEWIALSNIVSEYGAEPKAMAFREWDEEGELGGGDVLPVTGYRPIIESLAKGLTVHLSTRVKRIEWSEEGALVVADRGKWKADACVVTLPLGVLKKGDVTFAPSLPKARASIIGGLDMGLLDKIVLRFPKKAWPDGEKILADVGDPIFNEFVDMSGVVGAPVLVGLCGGDRARGFEALTDRQATDRAVGVLRAMLGANLGAPTGMLRTRWASDPFSHGSYSYVPVGGRLADMATLAKPLGALYFAGEATNPTYFATVHGAYMSGLRAAREVVAEA